MFPGFISISKTDHSSTIKMLTIQKNLLKITLFALICKKAVLCEKLSFSVRFFHNLHSDTGCVTFFPCLYDMQEHVSCFIVSSNIFGYEITKGKFSKKLQLF